MKSEHNPQLIIFRLVCLSLFFLLLASCINIEKTGSLLFTDKLVDHWEKATIDSIKSIYEKNKKTKVDTFQLMLLSNNITRLYNHQARLHFIADLKHDTTFLNAHINNCILVEQSNRESNMYFKIIYSTNNQNICLSYKFGYTTDVRNKSFIFYAKDTIDNKKLQKFIQEVRKSDLFKNENNTGEYYFGDILISFFSKDRVEVFPYLTFNFSNDLYRSYNKMFQ